LPHFYSYLLVAILSRFDNVHLVGIDRDPLALSLCKGLIDTFPGRVSLANARFSNVADVLKEHNLSSADAFLFDLGVSSMQLDQPDRGRLSLLNNSVTFLWYCFVLLCSFSFLLTIYRNLTSTTQGSVLQKMALLMLGWSSRAPPSTTSSQGRNSVFAFYSCIVFALKEYNFSFSCVWVPNSSCYKPAQSQIFSLSNHLPSSLIVTPHHSPQVI